MTIHRRLAFIDCHLPAVFFVSKTINVCLELAAVIRPIRFREREKKAKTHVRFYIYEKVKTSEQREIQISFDVLKQKMVLCCMRCAHRHVCDRYLFRRSQRKIQSHKPSTGSPIIRVFCSVGSYSALFDLMRRFTSVRKTEAP